MRDGAKAELRKFVVQLDEQDERDKPLGPFWAREDGAWKDITADRRAKRSAARESALSDLADMEAEDDVS